MRKRNAVFYLLVALILIIPVFVNPFSDSYFSLSKVNIFLIFVSAALFLELMNPGQFADKIRRFFGREKTFSAIIFLLLAALLISTICSQSLHLSLFGGARSQGLISWLFYIVFAVLAAININSREKFMLAIKASLLSAGLVVIIGILQQSGLMNYWRIYDQGMGSTLGHPSFLGAWLAMLLPVCLSMLWIRKRSGLWLWAVLFLVSYGIIFSQTRGAWLGALVALGIMIFIYLYGKSKKATIGFFIAVMILAPMLGYGLKDHFLTATGNARIIWWQQSISVIRERPFFGHGLETQKDLFFRKFQKKEAEYVDPRTSLDRAHNEYLDILMTGGFFLLVSYLGIVAYCLRRGLKALSRADQEKKALIAGLIAGLAAFLVQSFFSFSTTALQVFFWLFLALLLALSHPWDNGRIEDVSGKKFSFFSKAMIAVFTLLAAFNFSARPLVADFFFQELKRELEGGGGIEGILSLNEKAAKWSRNMNGELGYRHYFSEKLLAYLADKEIGEAERKSALQALEENNKRAYRLNPQSSEMMFIKGRMTELNTNIESLEGINSYYRQFSEISPEFFLIYREWGESLERWGDFAGAAEKYRTALELLPEPAAGQSSSSKEVYSLKLLLSSSHYSLGQHRAALDYARELRQSSPMDYRGYYQEALILAGLEEYGQALESAFKALELTDNPKAMHFAAFLCLRAGDLDRARNTLEKTLKIHPGYQPALLMLDEL